MRVVLHAQARRALGGVGPDDAVVVLLEEARVGVGDLLVDLAQLPALVLPAHVDVLAHERGVELGGLRTEREAVGHRPRDRVGLVAALALLLALLARHPDRLAQHGAVHRFATADAIVGRSTRLIAGAANAAHGHQTAAVARGWGAGKPASYKPRSPPRIRCRVGTRECHDDDFMKSPDGP